MGKIALPTWNLPVHLAVHWPTDLVGGLLIGATWLWLTWWAFARFRVAVSPRVSA